MKNWIFILFLSLFNTGCELIVIGTRAIPETREIVEYNQKSALGTIYLFKAELDSNNVPAASNFIRKSDGDKYLAIERYERFYDIHRVRRMISSHEITDIKFDSFRNDMLVYKLEFNFRRKLYFNALKIDNDWYITDMGNYE